MARKPAKPKQQQSGAPSVKQIAADIHAHLRESSEGFLKRNVMHSFIPVEDLDVLYSYLGVTLTCQIFRANSKIETTHFTARMKVRAAEEESRQVNSDESAFEPHEPSGIGDWQYADRIKQKVFRALEGIINQSASSIGHNQFVQAARALIDQAEKTKTEAAEVMMAYEKQLIVLAEHLVESFLPRLGKKIREELKLAEIDVLDVVTEKTDPESEHAVAWLDAIEEVVRKFELKRYELILAETMAENQKIVDAFDFTKDLIENYKQSDFVPIEEKETQQLKKHMSLRKSMPN